jgi:hypothetical protein
MKISSSIEIAAPKQHIWPFLIEPLKIRQWAVCASVFERTGDAPDGIGATFYFEERAVGRTMKLHFVITEWVVNERMAYKMVKGNLVKGYEQRYTLESTPSGCRCTCYENVSLPYGILGQFALLFRHRYSIGLLNGQMGKLKGLVEGGCVVKHKL